MASFGNTVAVLSLVRHDDVTPLAQCVHKSVTGVEKKTITECIRACLQRSRKKDGCKAELSCGQGFDGSVYTVVTADAMFVAAFRNPHDAMCVWEFMEKFVVAMQATGVDLKKARAASLHRLLKPMREIMNSYNNESAEVRHVTLRRRTSSLEVEEVDESETSSCSDSELSTMSGSIELVQLKCRQHAMTESEYEEGAQRIQKPLIYL
jgi:hypothetical protein